MTTKTKAKKTPRPTSTKKTSAPVKAEPAAVVPVIVKDPIEDVSVSEANGEYTITGKLGLIATVKPTDGGWKAYPAVNNWVPSRKAWPTPLRAIAQFAAMQASATPGASARIMEAAKAASLKG